VGKTTCARIFAKTINCLTPVNGFDACNECESCKAFNEQRSYNIHELDAASNNSVEDIRSLIEQVRIPPQIGKYSVYIIDEVHMLSTGAFNALLKTLEEPPSYAIFILATTEKHKVLPTILSRCQVYDFSRITVPDTIAYLQSVAAKEGITASEEALNVVAQKADGGMRDALSIFDQLVAFCGKEITYERTIEVLNVLDSDYYFQLVDHALRHDVSNALLLLNDVLNHGFDAAQFVVGFAQHLRDVLVSKDVQTLPLLETSDAIRQRYAAQAAQCAPLWIFQALDIVNTCDINYRTARNKRLTVELALVKLCQLGVVAQPAQPVQPVKEPVKAVKTVSPVSPASPVSPVKAAITNVEIPQIPTIGLNIGFAKNKPSEEKTEAAPATNTAPREERNNPFTHDQLVDAWVGLQEQFKTNTRILPLLEAYTPTIIDDLNLELEMPNKWQLEEMQKTLPMLLQCMRDALQNDHLNMQLTLKHYAPDQMAFTAEDIYKQMAKNNPALAMMKEKLQLQLD
jgi:DNA polymerase-3 subunit gamma/tau